MHYAFILFPHKSPCFAQGFATDIVQSIGENLLFWDNLRNTFAMSNYYLIKDNFFIFYFIKLKKSLQYKRIFSHIFIYKCIFSYNFISIYKSLFLLYVWINFHRHYFLLCNADKFSKDYSLRTDTFWVSDSNRKIYATQKKPSAIYKTESAKTCMVAEQTLLPYRSFIVIYISVLYLHTFS